jgi:hypothetical protein
MSLTAADINHLRASLQRGERLPPLAFGLGFRSADALVLELLTLVRLDVVGGGVAEPPPTAPALVPFDPDAVGLALAAERCDAAPTALLAEPAQTSSQPPAPTTVVYTSQRAWIRALLHAGTSLQEIMAEVGCNRQAVYDVRSAERKAGHPPPVQARDPGPIGRLPLQEVIDRYQAGEPLTALADETGLTANGVRFRLRKAGVRIVPSYARKAACRQHKAVAKPVPSAPAVQPKRQPPPPPERTLPVVRPAPPPAPGSARDLAAMAAAAVAAGFQVTTCPTVAAAPTEGARIKPEDAAVLRRHADALQNDAHAAAVGRGRRAAMTRALSTAGKHRTPFPAP